MSRSIRLGLLALGGASLLLYVPGVTWGLPSAFGWAPDELLPSAILDGLAQGFSGGWASKYPPFHQVLLGLLYLPVLWLHGLDVGSEVPGHVYLRLFLLNRGVSLLMAAGCVTLVYACGRELLDRRGALFATALAATLLPFAFYAKLANLEAPYLFWSLLALRFLLRARRPSRRRALVGFAVTAVLAVATKDQAYGFFVLSAALLLLAHLRGLPGGSPAARFRQLLADRDLWLAAAAALVAFAVAFNLLLNWTGFVEHVQLITGRASQDYQLFPATLAGQASLARQSAFNLAFCLGLPGLAVCLLGVGAVVARRLGWGTTPRNAQAGRPDDRGLLWLLVPALSYYASFVAVVLYSYDRFMLPIAVLLCFFGGRILSEATAWPGWQGRLGRLAALVVVVYGLARCVSLDVSMQRDTRYSAERWLAQNVAKTQNVAGIGALPHLPRLDALRWTTLPPSEAALEPARPDWLVVNADLGRRSRPGSARERFYRRLERGELGYVLAWRERFAAPLTFFDSERLNAGAYGPVLSNLERVNPEIHVYRRAAR